MKLANVLEKIIWNLVSWYYVDVFLHAGSVKRKVWYPGAIQEADLEKKTEISNSNK